MFRHLRSAAPFALLLTSLPLASTSALAQTTDQSAQLAPGVFSPDGKGALQSAPGERTPHTLAPFDTTPDTAAASRPSLDVTGVIKDREWAMVLGKALFWDTVAAARGTNCSSCHFTSDANRGIPDQSVPATQLRRVATNLDAATQSADDTDLYQIAFGRSAGSEDVRGVVDVCDRGMTQVDAEIPDSGRITRVSSLTSDTSNSSCANDTSARLARSVLQRRPLGARSIDPNDSLFGETGPHGNLVSTSGRGLEKTYEWLVQQAFDEKLWKTGADTSSGGDGDIPRLKPIPSEYQRIERNFPLFWGIAVFLYESTVSDDLMRYHALTPEAGWVPQPQPRNAPSTF